MNIFLNSTACLQDSDEIDNEEGTASELNDSEAEEDSDSDADEEDDQPSAWRQQEKHHGTDTLGRTSNCRAVAGEALNGYESLSDEDKEGMC